MRTMGERSNGRQRWARWYPKKDDDKLIERWAFACSKTNDDCRNCRFMNDCQDLADRLIGCMHVPSIVTHTRVRKAEPRQQFGYG